MMFGPTGVAGPGYRRRSRIAALRRPWRFGSVQFPHRNRARRGVGAGAQPRSCIMLSIKVVGLCFVALAMVAASGAKAANPVVVMETNMGTIKIELFEDKAPATVKNFLSYVEDKHYD